MQGIAFMALGMFLFSATDTCAKLLTDSVHPVQVAWARSLGLLLGVLVLLALRGPSLLRTDHRPLQIVRGALAAASAMLFIVAIAYVPLADAVAITFVARPIGHAMAFVGVIFTCRIVHVKSGATVGDQGTRIKERAIPKVAVGE